jgi:hypothetical protein
MSSANNLALGIVIVIVAAAALLQELGLGISRAVAWLAAVAGAGLALVALSGLGVI